MQLQLIGSMLIWHKLPFKVEIHLESVMLCWATFFNTKTKSCCCDPWKGFHWNKRSLGGYVSPSSLYPSLPGINAVCHNSSHWFILAICWGNLSLCTELNHHFLLFFFLNMLLVFQLWECTLWVNSLNFQLTNSAKMSLYQESHQRTCDCFCFTQLKKVMLQVIHNLYQCLFSNTWITLQAVCSKTN